MREMYLKVTVGALLIAGCLTITRPAAAALTQSATGLYGETKVAPVRLGPLVPVPGAIIVAFQGGREVGRVAADINGRFFFPLNPGYYTIVPLQPLTGGNSNNLYARQFNINILPHEYTNVVVVFYRTQPAPM